MGCIYKIKTGQSGLSPEFTDAEFSTILSKVGAKTLNSFMLVFGINSEVKFELGPEEIRDKITHLNEEEKTEIEADGINAEYVFKDVSRITPLQAIERSEPDMETGIPFGASLEEYIDWYVKTQSVDPDKTQEEIAKEVLTIVANWENSCLDGMMLHNFFPLAISAALNDSDPTLFDKLFNRFKTVHGEDMSSRFSMTKSLLRDIVLRINHYINSLTAGSRSASVDILRNIHLSANLNADAKELLEASKMGIHIDNILIGNNNTAHVFNYKFAVNPFGKWASIKKKKYELEAGAIRSILKSNNLDIENSFIYNIPLLLVYDEDGKIKDILFKDRLGRDIGISYNVYNDTNSPIAKAEAEMTEKFLEKSNQEELDKIPEFKLDESFLTEDDYLRTLMPNVNLETHGILLSAMAYIRENINTTILKHEDGIGYDVIKPDGSIEYIKSNKEWNKNEELILYISSHLEEFNQELPIITSTIVEAIRKSYELGYADFAGFGFKRSSLYLTSLFKKYFTTYEKNGETLHEWTPLLNDKINNLGIFLFLNSISGEVDMVILTALKPDEMISQARDQTNLLGYYTDDLALETDLKSCYGHLELMRGVSVLNALCELIPDLKLSGISIFSPYFNGNGMWYSASFAIKEFVKTRNYLNKHLNKNYKNNFLQALIASEYDVILSNLEALEYNNSFLLETVLTADNIAAKYNAIKDLMLTLEQEVFFTSDPLKIEEYKNSSSVEKRKLFKIWEYCTRWMMYYYGYENVQIELLSELMRNIMPLYANPDENVRILNNAYLDALNKVASDFTEDFTPLRKIIQDYELANGITVIDTLIIGSTEGVYRKFYKTDTATGKNTFTFVNPYNDEEVSLAGLNSLDIKFLKTILFALAKSRANTNPDFEFKFKNIDDPALKAFATNPSNHYCRVPLTLATNARHKIETMLDSLRRKLALMKTWKGVKEYIKNLGTSTGYLSIMGKVDGLSIYSLGTDPLKKTRTLLMSENDMIRALMLQAHPEEYFDINIGNILSEYIALEKYYNRMRDVEIFGKSLLTTMYFAGEHNGLKALKLLLESTKYVEEYMKLTLYNLSIMSNWGLNFVKMMAPFKKIMNTMYLTANLRGMFRDSLEGVLQNAARTITHYDNHLTGTDVLTGYTEVLKHVFQSLTAMNILSELCLKYRLSNCDSARIAERAKTGTGGILNPVSLSMSTLRGPDFLNRMTLFVARCINDGSWDAFKMIDGHLEYDPSEDKRFRDYFKSAKGTKEYNEAKSRYFTACLEYNKLNPDKKIEIGKDKLPEPYDYDEIENFKRFADKIYGAYDRSQRARYEHIALGYTLGTYTTWLNGPAAAWFAKPGKYHGYFKTKDETGKAYIKKNSAGNELYFDENGGVIEKRNDKFYNEKNEEVLNAGDCPVIDKVPIPVLGIIYTFKNCWSTLKTDGFSSRAFKEHVWKYQTNKDNINKLLMDMLMMGIFGLLFGCIFTPDWAKDSKRRKKVDSVLGNATIDLLYNSSRSSFDGFFGPISMFNYVLTDMLPSIANANLKITKDVWLTLTGDKTFNNLLYSNVPVFKLFRGALKTANPDMFKAN